MPPVVDLGNSHTYFSSQHFSSHHLQQSCRDTLQDQTETPSRFLSPYSSLTIKKLFNLCIFGINSTLQSGYVCLFFFHSIFQLQRWWRGLTPNKGFLFGQTCLHSADKLRVYPRPQPTLNQHQCVRHCSVGRGVYCNNSRVCSQQKDVCVCVTAGKSLTDSWV